MALKISKTRIDFFSMLSKSENKKLSEAGLKMLKVIELISNLFIEIEIIALSSHENLLLFSPKFEDRWIIFISTNPKYLIKFQTVNDNKSVGEIDIYIEVDSIENFKKNLIIAMKKSEAWNESLEFENLFKTTQ